MDSSTAMISAVVLASVSIAGVLGKLIHSMRGDIKECFCIKFRTPENSEQSSSPPRNTIRSETPTPANTPQITVPNYKFPV